MPINRAKPAILESSTNSQHNIDSQDTPIKLKKHVTFSELRNKLFWKKEYYGYFPLNYIV